jgi:hypothetical protein
MSDLPLWLQIVGGLCAVSFVVRKMGPAALVRGGGQRRCDRKTARSEAPRLMPEACRTKELTRLHAADLAACEARLKAWLIAARGGTGSARAETDT